MSCERHGLVRLASSRLHFPITTFLRAGNYSDLSSFFLILLKCAIATSNAITTTNHGLKRMTLQAVLQPATHNAAALPGAAENVPRTLGTPSRELRESAGPGCRCGFRSPGSRPSPAHRPPLSISIKIKADKPPMQDEFPISPNQKPNPEALNSWSRPSL